MKVEIPEVNGSAKKGIFSLAIVIPHMPFHMLKRLFCECVWCSCSGAWQRQTLQYLVMYHQVTTMNCTCDKIYGTVCHMQIFGNWSLCLRDSSDVKRGPSVSRKSKNMVQPSFRRMCSDDCKLHYSKVLSFP